MSAERVTRCRYLRRSGEQCPNPAALPDAESPLLCPKHLYRAHDMFTELAKVAGINLEEFAS